MDVWATHMPMVAAIASKTKGSILEMGCGYYSTYILHEICRLTKRKLVTLDEKADWLNKFLFLESDFHNFHFVKDWASFILIDTTRWDMVLVDHAPGERRKVDIDRLKDNADYLVVHDTETASYEYEPVLSKFKYRFDYKLVRPWTTVISNIYDLNFLRE